VLGVLSAGDRLPASYFGGWGHMEKLTQTPSHFRFGPFQLDASTGELAENGDKTRLHEQSLQVLLALLAQPGELVTREELVHRLWPAGTFVDFDRSLNKAVNKLREALADSPVEPRFIETLPRRGYRFIAPFTHNGQADLAGTVDSRFTAHKFVRRHSLLVSAAAVVVLVASWLLYIATRHPGDRTQAASSKVTLAVLPFDNLSGDPDQEYLSDSMTEEMIAELGQLSPAHLAVIARATSMYFQNSHKTAEQIGRELHVDYLLEGSVRRSASHIRITAELIQAKDQTHLWAGSFDRDVHDILALQTDVAGAIANHINVKFNSIQNRGVESARAINPEAYESYLKGLYYLRLWGNDNDGGNVVRSQEYLERAITIDPGYALAYTRLAQSYFVSVFQGQRPRNVMPKAEALARRALSLDPGLAEAHDILANVNLRYNYDFAAAEKEAKLAIDLNPNYPEAHDTYADYLSAVGRHEEALAEERHATELDPLFGSLTWGVGWHLFVLKRYDEALAQFRKLLEPEADSSAGHYWMGEVYEQKGMYKEAVDEWKTAYTLDGDKDMAATVQRAYDISGYHGAVKARDNIESERIQRRLERGKFVDPMNLARRAARRADRDEAFQWLNKAYEEHSPGIPMLMMPGEWKELRTDPRFEALVRRVGIPHQGS
jgi:TolB-like protein/DNA-binding winged helix-turn-helix (wHTH) protein/tetratricopeptide (TPR) repeat protein